MVLERILVDCSCRDENNSRLVRSIASIRSSSTTTNTPFHRGIMGTKSDNGPSAKFVVTSLLRRHSARVRHPTIRLNAGLIRVKIYSRRLYHLGSSKHTQTFLVSVVSHVEHRAGVEYRIIVLNWLPFAAGRCSAFARPTEHASSPPHSPPPPTPTT